MISQELTGQHLDQMVSIIERCRQSLGLGAELAWSKDSLRDAMKSGKVIGAFVDEKLAAFVLYIEIGGSLERTIEIWCLATDPAFQRQGLMGSLVAEIQGRVDEIWLEVHERNERALIFYKNKGFQQVGVRKRYYEDAADAQLLSWSSKKP